MATRSLVWCVGVRPEALIEGLDLPGNRARTAADWLTEAVLSRQTVQLGLVRSGDVPLDTTTPAGLQ